MMVFSLKYPIIVLLVVFNCTRIVRSINVEEFNYCMRDAGSPGLRMCMGKTAINFLQAIDEQDNFTLFKDFIAEKDDRLASRSILNFLDQDPVDFRGIMENAGTLFSQRSLQWHLDNIYPGLMFKIGPSADSNSVAEFVMDPKLDDRHYTIQEPSTAKILTKQYLLPMLLGFKFNLVTLVPLIFAGVVLLLKKSIFLAKFAMYLSTVFGIGGAASLGTMFDSGSPTFGPGYGHGHGHGHLHEYGGGGHFPGKIGIVGNYQSDVLSHDPDYSRNDRKVTFDKPREFVSHSTPSPDRFYDYEKTAMLSDRNSKTIKSKKDNNDYSDPWDGWHVIS